MPDTASFTNNAPASTHNLYYGLTSVVGVTNPPAAGWTAFPSNPLPAGLSSIAIPSLPPGDYTFAAEATCTPGNFTKTTYTVAAGASPTVIAYWGVNQATDGIEYYFVRQDLTPGALAQKICMTFDVLRNGVPIRTGLTGEIPPNETTDCVNSTQWCSIEFGTNPIELSIGNVVSAFCV